MILTESRFSLTFYRRPSISSRFRSQRVKFVNIKEFKDAVNEFALTTGQGVSLTGNDGGQIDSVRFEYFVRPFITLGEPSTRQTALLDRFKICQPLLLLDLEATGT